MTDDPCSGGLTFMCSTALVLQQAGVLVHSLE
jgi:hypothetical protein